MKYANTSRLASGGLVNRSQETYCPCFPASDKSVLVHAEQTLDGGDVLPGFVLRLTDLLDRGRRPRIASRRLIRIAQCCPASVGTRDTGCCDAGYLASTG